MNPHHRQLLLAVSMLLWLTVHGVSGAADELAEDVEAIRQRHQLPALAAAWVHPDGTIQSVVTGVRAAGSDVAVTDHDAFHVGSLTKAMTATLIARLIDEGRLSWNSTVGEILPEIREQMLDDYESVTIRQLLGHRSGLPDDRNDLALVFRVRQLEGPMRLQRRRACEIFLSRAPASDPGTSMAYANANYVIAAHMAEAVAGQDWEELVADELFRPLGMESAGFGSPGLAGALDQPRGHRALGTALFPISPGPNADNPAVSAPAGGVHCSISDLAVFVRSHLPTVENEFAVISTDALTQLHTDPENDGYALGWGVIRDDQGRITALQHAGSNTMWYAVMRLELDSDHAFAVATNAAGDAARTACREVLTALRTRAEPERSGQAGPFEPRPDSAR